MQSKFERDKAIRRGFSAGRELTELATFYRLSLRSIYYIVGSDAVKERAAQRRVKAEQAVQQARAFYQVRIDTALDAVKKHSISLRSAALMCSIDRRRLSAEQKIRVAA